MPEQDPKKPQTQAKDLHAAAEQAMQQASTITFLDLSSVDTYSKNVVEPRFTITYRGNVGQSSIRGAEVIQSASKARNLSSPTPCALMIHLDNTESTTLYGVPAMEKHATYLPLEWVEQNRQVRANFQGILRAKQIEIPQGTKMVIKVEHIQHPTLGECVKLSWPGDCFVAINEVAEGEDEADT